MPTISNLYKIITMSWTISRVAYLYVIRFIMYSSRVYYYCHSDLFCLVVNNSLLCGCVRQMCYFYSLAYVMSPCIAGLIHYLRCNLYKIITMSWTISRVAYLYVIRFIMYWWVPLYNYNNYRLFNTILVDSSRLLSLFCS
jgi:hypothetical protein